MKHFPFLLIAACFTLAGCQQPPAPTAQDAPLVVHSEPSVESSGSVFVGDASNIAPAPIIPPRKAPPLGKVLIVPQKVQSSANEVRWIWTIYGDPKWRPNEREISAKGSEENGRAEGSHSAKLYTSRPDGPGPTGKASIYEYGATLQVSDSGQGSVKLDTEQTLRNVGRQPSNEPNAPWVDDGHGIARSESPQYGLQRFDVAQSTTVLLKDEQTFTLPFDKPVLEVNAKKADGTPYKLVYHLIIPK